MDTVIAAIEVPLSDEAELTALTDRLRVAGSVAHSRGLDGDTVAQLVLTLSAMSLPVLRAWLVARAEHRKSTIVSWKGRRFVGYSAKEVAELTEALSRTLGPDEDLPEGSQ